MLFLKQHTKVSLLNENKGLPESLYNPVNIKMSLRKQAMQNFQTHVRAKKPPKAEHHIGKPQLQLVGQFLPPIRTHTVVTF